MRKMVELETLCEKLSYGAPRPVDMAIKAVDIFKELEGTLRGML